MLSSLGGKSGIASARLRWMEIGQVADLPVQRADTFQHVIPIWSNPGIPPTPQVVFFRRAFELDAPLRQAELQIFADTRYELWVDGDWVGRGPARFSATLREYDVYSLGGLAAGEHLVAVQVQWAPNNRRAESVAPVLMVLVQGMGQAGLQPIAMTSTQWRCQVSDAWNQHAAPLDTRGLIGPTELLDLRRLPSDWNQVGFSDASWPQAVAQTAGVEPQWNTPQFQLSASHLRPVYQPRSIALLENAPISLTLREAGRLSPGFTLGEVEQDGHLSASTYTLLVTALRPADLELDTLFLVAPRPGWARIDGEQMDWQPSGSQRPDVYRVSRKMDAGVHKITFDQSLSAEPAYAPLLAISQHNIKLDGLTLQQGDHAGRRILLANPQPETLDVRSAVSALHFDALPAYAVLDLGRTVHGRLVAEVTGPAGSMVDMGWDERLWGEGQRPLPFPGSMYPEWNQVDSWVLDGSRRVLTTIDARAGRYILITAWGNGPVILNKLQVYEERYPLLPRGEFHSSDPLLDQIWQVGVDTLRPNLTDALTDTPWRERGQWWGDVYVAHQIGRLAFDDTPLLRRGLVFMADAMLREPAPGRAPNNAGLHMLDYTMLWVHSLADYVEQTQDWELGIRLYPAVKQFLDHLRQFENPGSGLLDIPQGHWASTAYVDVAGYASRYGQSSALNALYAATLRRAAQIAWGAGDGQSAQQWIAKAQEVQQELNALLYIPSEQRYWTHFYQGTAFKPTPHAQAWPLAYGLVPEGEMDGVANALIALLAPHPASPNVGTYGIFWVLDALGKTGHILPALDLIRLYYGNMLEAGSTTWWEAFNADQYAQSSFSHAWSGAPTYFLTTYVLGAQWIGGNHWKVQPAFAGVEFASGAIPLQDGILRASWVHARCGTFQLDVVAPPGTQGEVVVPLFAPGLRLALNGEILGELGAVKRGADRIHLSLGAGAHQIHGFYDCRP